MFKSSEVAYLEPSNFSNKSCILGIEKGFLLILLLSSLKSEMKRTVPFISGIIKVGATYLILFLRFNTPIFINLLTFVFKVSLCILGIGKGLAWYGLFPSKNSISELKNCLVYHQTCFHVLLIILGLRLFIII